MNALISADFIGERHFGFTVDDQGGAVEADPVDIESGSLFINALNMLNSRDNLRQGVVDLINVAASIQIFDIDDNYITQGDLADVPVNFIGHSLGGISGGTFASIVNDPTLNATINGIWDSNTQLEPFTFPSMNSVVLHNTGGQVTRLLENSVSRSGDLLDGLAAKGITQETSSYESFFYIFQSLLDGTDPINFAVSLGNSTNGLLITEVTGDSTVPNEANVNPLNKAYSAPLAGTEPYMALLDIGQGGTSLSDGTEVALIDTGDSSDKPAPVAVFFDGTNPCSDANHGTFVGPQAPNENCSNGLADTSIAFTAMVTQTAEAVSGLDVSGSSDPAVGASLGVSVTIEQALDQDQ
ncbi:hypothetical protein [Marinobacter similis]|uniref:hypothetical protein n=1 Tax=Marinobacter similis TaxID=1420916 RepID=UPI000AA5024E|nr:hypothetical protein [Marinobacter similis]